MEASSEYKNTLKKLFALLEPDGNGKVHKDTLKKNMKKMISGSMMDDKALDQMIQNMGPDKDGMISTKSYMNMFSMPQFSAEEAAAIMKLLKKSPELLDGLMDSKSLAAKMGFNKPQEVEKIMGQLKDCCMENLEQRLTKEPPKSKRIVREKQAMLLKAIGKNMDEMNKQSQ